MAIVYRSAEGDVERLLVLAAELVRLQVAVIASVGGDRAVLSAKTATKTVPIVFTTGGDPVETAFVAAMRPVATSRARLFWAAWLCQSRSRCCATWCQNWKRSACC